MGDIKSFLLRMPISLYALIEDSAAKNDKSANQLIVNILADTLTASRVEFSFRPKGDAAGSRAQLKSETGSIPAGPTQSDSHDPKTCRVYKCGMCAAVKA